MANLIDQMNVLKGLSDEHLQAELSAPSGATPPFLVATEIGRRKDMRQRYEGEAARRQKATTVAEDLTAPTGGMPPQQPPATMPMMNGGGTGIAAAPQRSFASGGIVDAVDYNEIAQRYMDMLDDNGSDKDRARAMALLTAGAGIMSGGHKSTFRNIGEGISAGVGSYAESLKAADAEEMGALRGVTDIGTLQHQDELARLEASYRERALAQDQSQFDQRLTTDKTPADILKLQWLKDHPEDKDLYMELNPAFNPNSLTNDLRVADKVDQIYADTQKLYPLPQVYPGVEPTPEETAAAQQQVQKARIEAYTRIKSAYGAAVADNWAAGMGLAVGDLVLGGVPAPVLDEKDPLGLGL